MAEAALALTLTLMLALARTIFAGHVGVVSGGWNCGAGTESAATPPGIIVLGSVRRRFTRRACCLSPKGVLHAILSAHPGADPLDALDATGLRVRENIRRVLSCGRPERVLHPEVFP